MTVMSEADKVRRAQARAQDRADAAAIEAKRVRAFLRFAMSDDAKICEVRKVDKPKSKHKKRHGQPHKSAYRVDQKSIPTITSKVITGEYYKPSLCKCLAWDACTCGKRS